ncbi:RraA family protein [Streptosporangium sp. NPDC001559]|uniref:RraA family protein n=1 Tax=Streptosporangium sp. NPDC001559 TaxID=3366187 RepID=UPI0036E30B59
MTDEIVKGLAEAATSGISDALDRLGIAGQVHGIQPLDPDFALAGRAFTGLYQPVDVNGGTVGDYIDDVPEGAVIVLDNRGRTDATVWGDILTLVASSRGVAGTVIDGVCRDSKRARELNYPVFSRGRYMRTGKDRVQMVGIQVPVTLGEVRVRPGDVLIGDGDGIVVVPQEREQEVLDLVREIESTEERIREQVQAGVALVEARRRLGYHRLQTKR